MDDYISHNTNNNFIQRGYPDIRDVADKVMEISQEINSLSRTAVSKEDKDRLTKLYFEQMLRGLYLDLKKEYYNYV